MAHGRSGHECEGLCSSGRHGGYGLSRGTLRLCTKSEGCSLGERSSSRTRVPDADPDPVRVRKHDSKLSDTPLVDDALSCSGPTTLPPCCTFVGGTVFAVGCLRGSPSTSPVLPAILLSSLCLSTAVVAECASEAVLFFHEVLEGEVTRPKGSWSFPRVRGSFSDTTTVSYKKDLGSPVGVGDSTSVDYSGKGRTSLYGPTSPCSIFRKGLNSTLCGDWRC